MKKKQLLILALGLLTTGCMGGMNDDRAPNEGGGSAPAPDYGGDDYWDYSPSMTDEERGEVGDAAEDGTNQNNRIKAGQLTCSALDDNDNYAYWTRLGYANQESGGIFSRYRDLYAFNSYNRVALNVINGKNAVVKLKDTNIQAHVDNLHKAYLFPTLLQTDYEVEISYVDSNNDPQTVTKTVHDGDTIDLQDTFTISQNLQIMFVIDATGSMGDEIAYLKAEVDDVLGKVKTANPTAHIELAIMMYRDTTDEYVTRYSDFTTDIESQRAFLAKQSAVGGGDTPEAVDVALEQAIIEKQWSSNATKLLFHVADAPAHDQDVQSWNTSVMAAASNGIKIISVASSGIDKKTEYFFRSQSILTGGQYVYLTNDSGIGNSHLEATVEEPLEVEYLNSCLVRLINGYFTGDMKAPISYKQEN